MNQPLPNLQPIDKPDEPLDSIPQHAVFFRLVVDDSSTSRGVPHVNNAEYVRWVDRAAELHCDMVGFTRETMLAANRMWFVARHEIDYRGECFVGDELIIATWVGPFSRTTSLRNTLVYRKDDRKVALEASTRWAYMDLVSRRPTRITDDIRAHFPLDPTMAAPKE